MSTNSQDVDLFVSRARTWQGVIRKLRTAFGVAHAMASIGASLLLVSTFGSWSPLARARPTSPS